MRISDGKFFLCFKKVESGFYFRIVFSGVVRINKSDFDLSRYDYGNQKKNKKEFKPHKFTPVLGRNDQLKIGKVGEKFQKKRETVSKALLNFIIER